MCYESSDVKFYLDFSLSCNDFGVKSVKVLPNFLTKVPKLKNLMW